MEDLQGRQEFVLEIGLAAADAGERRGRADHRAVAADGAVFGLDAPDRHDRVTVNAIGLLDRREGRLVFSEDLAALGDALVGHELIDIVPERLGELRLRVHQVHDAQVGFEVCGELVETRARDVAPRGVRPHPLDAVLEIGDRRQDRLRRHQRMARGAGLAAPRLGLRRNRAGCHRGGAGKTIVGLRQRGGGAECHGNRGGNDPAERPHPGMASLHVDPARPCCREHRATDRVSRMLMHRAYPCRARHRATPATYSPINRSS